MDLYNFFATSKVHSPLDLSKHEYKDFPYVLDTVWILGKQYNAIHDLENMRSLIRSKIWFSYRKGFPAIGGTGPSTDKHWGCMLRCGQMVMAEALIRRHLGRGWIWIPNVVDPVYAEILKMFQDKKDSPYSLHQIAQMGVSEGKPIGHWFGPNTIAQVLRKLSVYDEWSSLAVHVAFDNTVVKADIETLCGFIPEPLPTSPFTSHSRSIWYTDCMTEKCPKYRHLQNTESDSPIWRPLLLFVPLRLGVSSLNSIYCKGIKNTFMMKQSLGIIGGRPRHAVWFIGYIGNDLVYLDPHITQSYVPLDGSTFDDSTYHIPYGKSKRMPIMDIDPSLSLCFFFETKENFSEWCELAQKLLISTDTQPLFEIVSERPPHWPPLELRPDLNCTNCSLEYYFVEQDSKASLSDDDFEIFEPILPCQNSRPEKNS